MVAKESLKNHPSHDNDDDDGDDSECNGFIAFQTGQNQIWAKFVVDRKN